tara:strand:- start:194 stop:613 length:420 start_codon:yes stop_codon:yes gene_type:complete
MATLIQQLNKLNKEKEELEKKIQEEEENKRKLSNESSIERLDALIQPMTEYLDTKTRQHYTHYRFKSEPTERQLQNKHLEQTIMNYNQQIKARPDVFQKKPIKGEILRNEEIFVTIISILAKLDERLTIIEERLNKLEV